MGQQNNIPAEHIPVKDRSWAQYWESWGDWLGRASENTGLNEAWKTVKEGYYEVSGTNAQGNSTGEGWFNFDTMKKKFEEATTNEDGSFSWGKLLGGGIGIIGAWMVSGMFGGGWFGTIALMLLAIPAYIMGGNAIGPAIDSLMGNEPKAGKGPEHSQNNPAPEQTKGQQQTTEQTQTWSEEALGAAHAGITGGSTVTFAPPSGFIPAPISAELDRGHVNSATPSGRTN